jgi:hypothetical protein
MFSWSSEQKQSLTYRCRQDGSRSLPMNHGTDLHTMQSVSKTVTSVVIGVAMQRGDFQAGLDTPILSRENSD